MRMFPFQTAQFCGEKRISANQNYYVCQKKMASQRDRSCSFAFRSWLAVPPPSCCRFEYQTFCFFGHASALPVAICNQLSNGCLVKNCSLFRRGFVSTCLRSLQSKVYFEKKKIIFCGLFKSVCLFILILHFIFEQRRPKSFIYCHVLACLSTLS